MPSLRIPLVGSLTNRNVNATAFSDTVDQRFENCFPEVTANPITGKTQYILTKRPGSAASADVQANATGQYGAVIWTTNSAATPPVIFSYQKSTGTSVMFFDSSGAQYGSDVPNTSQCTFMSETNISGTGTLTATLVDYPSVANEAWYLPQAGAWTQVTSSGFPSGITAGHAHMDGYWFVMTSNGRIYNSDLNSLSSWNASNYIGLSSGGSGIGLARHGDLIVGFSDYATELFYNAGNAGGSVLNRVRDGVTRIGAVRSSATLAAPFYRTIGNSIYWVGQNADNGSRGIYRLEGNAPKKISNATVDRMCTDGTINFIVGSFPLFGMTHVAFNTFDTSLLCYCIETGFWWTFRPATTLTILAAIGGVSSGQTYTSAFMTSSINAKIYSFNPTPLWQDNGVAYTMLVQTAPDDLGAYRKKYFKSLELVGDSQTAASAVTVAYSDDDLSTFASAGTIDMNVVPPQRLTRLGASRRRSWKLTHAANTACRLSALQIDYSMGWCR